MPDLNTIFADYTYDLSEFARLRRELPKFAEGSTSVQAQYMTQVSHAAMTTVVKVSMAAGLNEAECKRRIERVWSLQAARDIDDAYKHGGVSRANRLVQEMTVTTKRLSEGVPNAAVPPVRMVTLVGTDGREVTLGGWVSEVDRDLRDYASQLGRPFPDDFAKD